MIRVEGVSKRFGNSEALRDVSFHIERGEVVGFLGPNGAGKTTTFRVLTGFIEPDAGTASVAGHDVVTARSAACAAIGYLPESVPMHPEMRVGEYLRYRARLKGVARSAVAERVERVTEIARIGDVQRRVVGHLSRGYRQRVGIADALIADPPVLLFDEPTSGLDPVQVRELRELLASLAEERTVLLASHVLAEVRVVAERFVVLAGGAVVADGDEDGLREQAGLAAGADLEDVFVALVGGER